MDNHIIAPINDDGIFESKNKSIRVLNWNKFKSILFHTLRKEIKDN